MNMVARLRQKQEAIEVINTQIPAEKSVYCRTVGGVFLATFLR